MKQHCHLVAFDASGAQIVDWVRGIAGDPRVAIGCFKKDAEAHALGRGLQIKELYVRIFS